MIWFLQFTSKKIPAMNLLGGQEPLNKLLHLLEVGVFDSQKADVVCGAVQFW